jgi:ubiquinone/menaquinone biosynthesis C-methylase UbiE
MIQKAKQNAINSKIEFIAADFNQTNLPNAYYDLVITYFFLDVFSEIDLQKVIDKIKITLKKDAVWLYSDFNQPKTYWQKLLMFIMKVFFRLTTRLKWNQLPNILKLLKDNSFKIESKTYYFGGFITAAYLKTNLD